MDGWSYSLVSASYTCTFRTSRCIILGGLTFTQMELLHGGMHLLRRGQIIAILLSTIAILGLHLGLLLDGQHLLGHCLLEVEALRLDE